MYDKTRFHGGFHSPISFYFFFYFDIDSIVVSVLKDGVIDTHLKKNGYGFGDEARYGDRLRHRVGLGIEAGYDARNRSRSPFLNNRGATRERQGDILSKIRVVLPCQNVK